MIEVNCAPLWCVWDMHKHQRDVTSLLTSKKLWQCTCKNINTTIIMPPFPNFLLLLAVRLLQFVTHKFSISTHRNSTNTHNKLWLFLCGFHLHINSIPIFDLVSVEARWAITHQFTTKVHPHLTHLLPQLYKKQSEWGGGHPKMLAEPTLQL